MSMTNEQIQALKAAAESCGKQEPLSLVVYHGKMCLRNKGGIVFTVLRDICFPEYSAENENYARLAELCTSDSILSLLAERDADKALIAEQAKQIDELEDIRAASERLVRCKGRYHSEQNYRALAALFGVSAPDLPPLDSEARTVTVKLPTKHNNPGFVTDGIWNKAIDECYLAFIEACTAAGITLDVGE
ncbi:hypothetical protein ACP3S7_18025 [Phytobacter ursingii]